MAYDSEYWFGLANLKKEFPDRPVKELQDCLDKYRIDAREGGEEKYHASGGCEFICAQFELRNPERKVHLSGTGLAWVCLEDGEGDKIGSISCAADGHRVQISWEGWALTHATLNKFRDEMIDVVHLKRRRILEGWLEALEDMKVGEKRSIMVPPYLGFGDGAVSCQNFGISPNDSCLFDIKVLDIIPPPDSLKLVSSVFFEKSGMVFCPRIESLPLSPDWQPAPSWKAPPDFKPPEDWGLPPNWRLLKDPKIVNGKVVGS